MGIESRIIDLAKQLEPYVIERRRDFHMYPEVKFEETRTSSIVEEELKQLGYKVLRTAETGIIGILNGGKEGKTVALRADMDALPIQEENDVPYKSRIPGKMHACGHDAHTAMLLGAAKILAEIKEHLGGTVKLIFQPGEEGGAGAKKIVEEGHLDDVDAIFGIHVWGHLPSGTIATKEGPIMASSDGFIIRIKGKGGHAASPHLTNDPTAPAVDIYNALQKIVSRSVNPLSPIVITTPMIEASHGYNVIPDSLEIRGTLRTFDMNLRTKIIEKIESIVKHYSAAWDCEGTLELFRIPYPPTINTPELAKFVMKTARELGPITKAEMTMGAEDFAFYLQKVPGAFIFLGIRNEEKGIIYPHHHPRFDVDESVLWKGSALYSLLAYKYLKGDE
ncbi:peptidase M20 [Thermococcus sp. EP1]|uniref:carboxypeptidase CpsA n=1 Tax=Thermococcus sp. EP1 TaxID=1591054 RepID=UPI0006DB9FC7|nr:carboxypeptidase CpsA [Thermococcus sp. EP1]KPU62507.1 peptidase M20 [Thermococcus sp. EP1]